MLVVWNEEEETVGGEIMRQLDSILSFEVEEEEELAPAAALAKL